MAKAKQRRLPSPRLIDRLLNESSAERAQQPFSKLTKRRDLVEHMPLLVRLLNSSKELGLRFLTDPLQFFDDLGIEMSDSVRNHVRRSIPSAAKPNKKAYAALRKGELPEDPIDALRFELPTRMATVKRKPVLAEATPAQALQADFSKKLNFLVPAAGIEPQVAIAGTDNALLDVDIGGWDMAIQIHESLLRELWNAYFYNHYVVAILLGAVGVDESEAIEPWHDYYTWFLTYIHVRLVFDINDPPEFSLDTHSSNRIKFVLRGQARLRTRSSTSDPWSEPDTFSVVIEKFATIRKRESGEFQNENLEHYFDVDLSQTSQIDVTVDEYPSDDFRKAFVRLAAQDYFATEVGRLPLTPSLQDSPPFQLFERASCFAVDTGANLDALALTFGEAGPLETYLIKPGHNFAMGLSAAVMHYMIRSSLPALPHRPEDNPEMEFKKMEVELRDGHVYLHGNGTYHTSGCWPNVGFSYSQIIDFIIDDDGKLQGQRRGDPSIDVHTPIILDILLPFISLAIDAIIDAIVQSMFGKEAGESIDEYLDISLNVESLFSGSMGPAELTANITEVEVNRNGLYFHGDLSVTVPQIW